MFYQLKDLIDPECDIDITHAVTMIKQVPKTSAVIGTPLSHLGNLFTTLPFSVLSIQRDGWPETVTPDTSLAAGDIVALTYNQQDYGRIIEIFGFSEIELLKAIAPEDLEVLQRIAA